MHRQFQYIGFNVDTDVKDTASGSSWMLWIYGVCRSRSPHPPMGNFNTIKFTYMYFSYLKQENNSGSASTDMFTIDGLPSLINVCLEDKHCDGIEVQTVSAKYWNNIFSRSAVARS